MTAREEILGKIRHAVESERESPRRAGPGRPAQISPEQRVRDIKARCEQKRGGLIERFASELTRIGGRFHRATSAAAALGYIEEVASDQQTKLIVGWDVDLIHDIGLPERLEATGFRFITENNDAQLVKTATEAGIGISGVNYALAETGTLVLLAGKGQARSISLLPPVHIALIKPEQIISDLNDLFPLVRYDDKVAGVDLSSAITFITGPSRTADIELTLVVGVHGPQQLHAVLLDC